MYGVDLLDVFRGRMSPGECLDLLTELPGDSAFMASLAADPDYWGDSTAREPTYRGWTPEAAALADVYDMLSVLVRQVAAIGGKPPKIPPYPRPGQARRAALEAAERAAARDEWAELCRRLGVRS